jgi:hypothetical protein
MGLTIDSACAGVNVRSRAGTGQVPYFLSDDMSVSGSFGGGCVLTRVSRFC